MFDFINISTRSPKRGVVEIYPKFIIGRSKDLMIRGSDFYAVWLEDRNLWSTDEQDVFDYIDNSLREYYLSNKDRFQDFVNILYMRDADSGMVDSWHRFVQKQLRDRYKQLDENIIFGNQNAVKEDYITHKLPYSLNDGKFDAYDELMSALYYPEERRKLEWAIGSIVNGDSKKIEKFIVMYGPPGSGKGTVIKIIDKLFNGYCSIFEAASLGSSKSEFATAQFKNNPLVGICPDADLSRMDKNTTLNSITSHEPIIINEKHKAQFTLALNTFLFMGTNEPINITSAKSGMMRRVIDVEPIGNKIPYDKYVSLMNRIDFELGAIAYHCKEVYESDPKRYDDYKPTRMIRETNDFYDFVLDNYEDFKKNDGVSLKTAWERYKEACEDNNVDQRFRLSKTKFQAELGNYFDGFEERHRLENGTWVRSYFNGFKNSIFDVPTSINKKENPYSWLEFKEQKSKFDDIASSYKAQYAIDDESDRNGLPEKAWSKVTTKLSELDTKKLHYVMVPQNHIVLDFDLKDESGNKSLELNEKAASSLPPTYAELSKSGQGIHLHYIYDGDVSKLSRIYSHTPNGDIEIKIFNGNSSLRRMLTKCNDLDIATISSGLPLKKEKTTSMLVSTDIKSDKDLHRRIQKCLRKEYENIPPSTAPNVNFIYALLEEAYNSDISYDVNDLYTAIRSFAANSTHQAQNCLKLVGKMHFQSKDKEKQTDDEEYSKRPIAFFDVEVFPNLFLVNWKKQGAAVNRMINPTADEITALVEGYRLVGFNCRKYDNHILYARMMGETNEQLYSRSQLIIVGDKQGRNDNGFFSCAYNLSYTDIYDYASKKQSLKKWEIELGIHHQELGLPWDEPVPENRWIEVAEYCDNDVISTEAVWNATHDDFTAREMLVTLANLLCPSITSVANDTTNTLTGRIVFRGDKAPQSHFVYTNLRTGERTDGTIDSHHWDGYRFFYDKNGISHSYLIIDKDKIAELSNQKDRCFIDDSTLSLFSDMFDKGQCIELNEGGLVIAEPGVHYHTITKDVASLHPHSVKELNLFGDYTSNYTDLVDIRVAIKHQDFVTARTMLNGALSTLIPENGLSEEDSKKLSKALKIAINAVYGLTSAKFLSLFKDPRNIDNIVAKRGALFMASLYSEVKSLGGHPIHIKTDSIKLENPTDDILEYVVSRGKEFGYDFETEAAYEKLCLVNNAVYIAKEEGKDKWEAVGTQFQVPYVFKKCFSHEDIVFSDMCETKEVKNSAMYIDLSHGELTDLQFVGRVGSFCPIKDGCGGGILYRTAKKKDGTIGYNSVVGTSGYEWLEAECVRKNHKENDIDVSYYDQLVTDAITEINKHCDFYEFVSSNPAPVKMLRSSIL